MRKSLRLIALLLCLVLIGSSVYAAEPIDRSESPATEAVTLTEPEAPVTTEPGEPVVTEPEEPVPTEPEEPVPTEPEEPVPTDPEDPVPTEPEEPVPTEPEEPEPTEPEPDPEPVEKPVSEMTDQEIIEKYSIPDYWARKALIFAVRCGLMKGRGNDDLAAGSNITHAELTAILMKILRTEKQADMSRFTDVVADTWYYGPMAKAVSLGLLPLADPNAKTLTPGKNITREETFVEMARMFGIKGTNRQAIYNFKDWKQVSDWAADDLAAIIETCNLKGDGVNLHPKDPITRAEVVQVFYRLLTKIGPSLEEADFTGSMAMYGSTVAPNTTVHGDLLISTDETSLNFENLTVTGRLVIQGNDPVVITMTGCSIGKLVLCRPAEVHSDTALQTVTALRKLVLDASANVVHVFEELVLARHRNVTDVNSWANTKLDLSGWVGTLRALGENVKISGIGRVWNIVVRESSGFSNSCLADNITQKPYVRITEAVATRTDSGKATGSAPTLTMGLKLTNMPEGPWSECDLVWFVDGKEISRSTRNLLKEGSVITASYNFSSYLDGFHTSVPFTVYITHKGVQSLLYKGNVNLEETVRDVALTIRTQNVQGWLRNKATLYQSVNLSSSTFSGALRELAANTKVTILQSRQSFATKVRLADGTVGWLSYYNVAIDYNQRYYITQDYSKAVKEYYVNHVRNWGSNKSYMIWVSLYTQRINIFQGYKGHWTLVRSGPIASGRNDCPTPVEDVTLGYHTTWYYDHYYCHHVTVFDEARGFHSRPTKYDKDGGGIYDYSIGYPASNGCVRLLDEDAVYVYGLPLGTAVHIY